MFAEHLLKYASFTEILLAIAILFAMFRRGAVRDFPALASLVAITGVRDMVDVGILFFRSALHLPVVFAYHAFFLCGWLADALASSLLVLVIYGLFNEAMRPFPGLQRIGKIIFRWVGAVSLLVAIALAVGPQLFSKGVTATEIITELATRFEQGIHVLILCLLIFVCFSIRPLGLTFRSKIFGVALGLGIASVVQLVEAAWFVTTGAHSVYSPVYGWTMAGCCIAMGVWAMYFNLPEPERRMILLPTTSPFFLWNRISEMLGDAPGQVVVAGFKPDMLAPAEIAMLTAATSREAANAREREAALFGSSDETPGRPEFTVSRPSLALSR